MESWWCGGWGALVIYLVELLYTREDLSMPAEGLLNDDKMSEAMLLYTTCLSERARRPEDQRWNSSKKSTVDNGLEPKYGNMGP